MRIHSKTLESCDVNARDLKLEGEYLVPGMLEIERRFPIKIHILKMFPFSGIFFH